jgi:hypothetical protein
MWIYSNMFIPFYYSLDDSPLLDQRYNNPMCFLQRYTFVMYFIQYLKGIFFWIW